jgi:hypothetical protein
MDVNNSHLKYLLDKTDSAFTALKNDPDNSELYQYYEQAQQELNHYIAVVKGKLLPPQH